MKKLTYISSFALLAALTACDSSDMPVQHPDSYDYISFSAKTQKLITRTNPYENYSPLKHPETMGVFGFYNASLNNSVFNNEKITYSSTTDTWTYSPQKRWDAYKNVSTYDFFAYMPQTAGATVTPAQDGSFTLSFPFTMSDGVSTPVVFDTKSAPIICALPVRKVAKTTDGKEVSFERMVTLQFDQTFTSYRLFFKLDPDMNKIRKFRITSVEISGDLATGGTVSRSYSLATDGSWTAGSIQWTNLTRQSVNATPVVIPYKESDSKFADNEKKTILVSNAGFEQWGDAFYTIPDPKFMPTISVTYDVELTAEDGSTVVTRKGIKSTIVLNKTNFSNLTTGTTAIINPVNILIQPRYLYVLSDDDAYTGHLLID